MPVVVDTSIFVDSILEFGEYRTLEIVNPVLFKVELACVLSRKLPENRVKLIVEDILEDVKLIPNPDDSAFEVAIKTGSRGADAYFIATAKLTNSILITNHG